MKFVSNRGRARGVLTALGLALSVAGASAQSPSVLQWQKGLHGYLSMNTGQGGGFGVSWYSAAFPMIANPVAGFQVGLPGTWITPNNDSFDDYLCPSGTLAGDQWSERRPNKYRGVFQTIEGGMGRWTTTRFPASNPKYRPNGTANCYNQQVSTPGWGFGELPGLSCDAMGLAQLSNRLVLPPDGVTVDNATVDGLLGVSWMAVPFTDREGYFQLTNLNLENENLCLAGNHFVAGAPNNGAAFMKRCNSDDPDQLWKVTRVSNGYVNLVTKRLEGQNRCLEGSHPDAGGPTKGKAFMGTCKSESNALFSGAMWRLETRANGYFAMRTAFTEDDNLCLEGARIVPGPPPVRENSFLWKCNPPSTGQLWRAKGVNVGNAVSTGDQSWTLFLNASNFSGPVAMYVPNIWSTLSKRYPVIAGRGLDAQPGKFGGGAMEFAASPIFRARGADNKVYTRIPKFTFPVDANGDTVLMRDIRMYSGHDFFQPMKDWITGRRSQMPSFPGGAAPPNCRPNTLAFTQTVDQWTNGEAKQIANLANFAQTKVFNGCSYGLSWKDFDRQNPVATRSLPEYFRLDNDQMVPVRASDLPPDVDLASQSFPSPSSSATYGISNGSCYSSPGAAGFSGSDGRPATFSTVQLTDGSTLTYRWYKFVDQPAVAALGLSTAEKNRWQRIAEEMHRALRVNTRFQAPPSSGHLVTLDNAVLVTPPRGLETGYVPIATEQRK